MNVARVQELIVSPSGSPPESLRRAWDYPALNREIARDFETIWSDPRKVIRDCDAALADDPTNAAALFVRGLARHALGVDGPGLHDPQWAIPLDGQHETACHTCPGADALPSPERLDPEAQDPRPCPGTAVPEGQSPTY